MRPRLGRAALIWLPPALYAGLIFWLSSQSLSAVRLGFGTDWVAHAVLYAGLGYVLVNSLRLAGRGGMSLVVVILCAAYGLSDEIHQSFVPGRTFEFMDIAADALGGYLAVLFCRVAAARGWPVWYG